jgi:hypothetical protein
MFVVLCDEFHGLARMTAAWINDDASFALDQRETGIHRTLLKQHPELASMYRDALRMPSSSVDDDDRRTRLAKICHAMRELMNRFRGGATTSAPSRDLVSGLPDLLAAYPELDLRASDQDLVAVPGPVAEVFGKILEAAVQEKIRSRERVADFLTDDGNVDHPAVAQWMDTSRFFVRWAHIWAKPVAVEDLPADGELRAKIRIVEDLIESVTKLFFEARRDVDDLLLAINRVEGETS